MALTPQATEAVLLAQQAPSGVPRSSLLAEVTDPALPPRRSADVLDHFPEEVYDKSADSHLSRFLKALVGDAGVGQLRKRYFVSRLQQVVLTTRYKDLDRFFGGLFGFRRLTSETLDLSPYFEIGDADEWMAIDARDASYRARIEQFSRAIPLCATKAGMAAVTSALLGGDPVEVYETYVFVDENTPNPGGAPPGAGARTYGDVEAEYPFYGDMDGLSYGEIEGGSGTFGRTTNGNRQEFVVRPKRAISAEENYHLMRVLTRLKPADALLTIDPRGVAIHSPVTTARVAADSTHWEVQAQVLPKAEVASAYPRGTAGVVAPRPRPALSGYQGEAWSYNSDVGQVVSYVEDADGAATPGYNYQRVVYPSGQVSDYTPDKALADATRVLLGRQMSDAVLTSAPYAPSRTAGVSG
jgi:hypothetical protein